MDRLMDRLRKYPCDNHPDRQEWIICDRKNQKLHLCYECFKELSEREKDERKQDNVKKYNQN